MSVKKQTNYVSSDTLSVVASEHRPFSAKQRALGKEDFTKIPHGVAGVQDRMSVIWERGVVCTHTDMHTNLKVFVSFSMSFSDTNWKGPFPLP